MDLEGRVVLVTGASRGVGAATAVAAASLGARVACAARATDEAPVALPGTIDETVRAIEEAGGEGVAVPTDLAVDEEVEAMVETTVAHFGRLDALVNNAAITFPGDLDLSQKRFDLVVDVDLRAPVIATRTALDHLRADGGGAVLNVSSAAALHYYPGLMAYGMAKVALEHFTRSAAAQLADDGVAVNCLRIDEPVASEGFVANAPELDHSEWAASSVAADCAIWMLGRPASYTGNVVGMADLRAGEGL